VLIQTYDPEHRVLAAARTHDVESFLAAELAERRALSYPPFTRLCAVMVSAPDEDRLEAALDWLAQALRSRLQPSGVQLLGPARAMMPRVNRRYRGQILLKGALAASAKREILSLFAELKSRPAAGRLDLQLDVDPSHLL
jgi:primosomal protein N' (replication factor Y)